MLYTKELSFFKSFIESFKIKVNTITEKELPQNIDSGIRKTLGLDDNYLNTFNIQIAEKNTVCFMEDIFRSKYIFIPLPQENEKSILVVGPYNTKAFSKQEIEEDALAYSLSQTAINNIQKYFAITPYIPDDNYINVAVNCLCDIIYGETHKSSYIKQSEDINDISVLIAGKKDYDTDSPLLSIQMIEKAYEQENKLLNAISQGLVHKADTFFTGGKLSDLLESRITDDLRNAKNYLIVLNTLARKAVEQGGVHPIYIDSVSTDFALQIEAAKSVNECDNLFLKMIHNYSRLVQKHSQKNYSLLIQKVITCIDTDISADLSLKTQAKLLNVNPSYLSTLFKKETGVTLTDYVNNKRVDRAKSLLKKSNIQIQNVAQSCGILDVNYFTKIFKKYTNLTPKEYREKEA